MSDRSRQRLRTITIILATALVIAPAAALAGHHFNDVPNSNVFHDDIEWMRANGVTAGCNPPANDEYCPNDNVTREQMAAFMHRLETENVFVRPGQDAVDGGNADTVDGMHAADFLAANQKAVDADKLDGRDDYFHPGNDGSGSGLDADTIDGVDSTAIGPPSAMEVTGADNSVTPCSDLSTCENIFSLTLDAGTWLIQTNAVVDNDDGAAGESGECGLASGTTLHNRVRYTLAPNLEPGQLESLSASALLVNVSSGTTIGFRCEGDADIGVEDGIMTAIEVDAS